MNRERWLAVGAIVWGVMLLFQGYIGAEILGATRDALRIGPDFSSFMSAEELRELQPLLYAMAFQGLLGLLALVLGVAVLRRAPWAHRALFIGSIVSLLSCVVVVVLGPHQWDLQAAFAVAPLAYLWGWHAKKRVASAP